MNTLDIKKLDIDTLHDIARMAWGSSEKDNGGRGYMGVIKDEQGRLRVIKYDTHFNQSSSANKNDLSQREAAQLLRDILVEIADRSEIGGADLNAIRSKLGMGGDNAGDPPKKLLERTVVASVVKMIDKDIWSKAIGKDANIKKYSSKNKDTRFSTVVRNVRVKGSGAILTPLANDKEIVDRQNNIRKGFECLLKEAEADDGKDANVSSCLGGIVPAEVKKLYAAEEAVERLKNRAKPDYEKLEDNLNCLAEEYGLDEKQKDKLRSVAEAAFDSDVKEDKYYKVLDEKLDELSSGDFDKWKELNEKYQDFYCKMGMIGDTLAKAKLDRLAKIPIRKLAFGKFHSISVEAFRDFATSIKNDGGDPVETILEEFGCSLDDLQKLEELGKDYSAAGVAANGEFDKLEKALKEKLGSDDRYTEWCEQLKKDFRDKLNLDSEDMLKSLGNLKQQLSDLQGTITKCLNENKLAAKDLLDKNLDQLFSLETEIRNEDEAARKAAEKETELLQEKGKLVADFPKLEKGLGDYFKELCAENLKKPIDDNLNKLTDVFKKVVDNCQDDKSFSRIRSVYEDLKSAYPSDFVLFFNEFNPSSFTADVVSEIQVRVRQLRDVAQMRDRLSEVGKRLKEDVTSDVVERIDHKISELRSAFGEKIQGSKSVDNALVEIEKMSLDTFLDDLDMKNLVAASDDRTYLARLNAEREISGELDQLGEGFKDKNCVFEQQLPNGKKIHPIIALRNDALIDQKIGALNEIFKQDLGEDVILYGDKCGSFKETLGFISRLPVAAFIQFPAEDLVKPETEAFKPLVLAQEKLLGEGGAAMKLQGIPAFYTVAQRLGDFVSGLATKLAKGEISVADATRDVNVIARLPVDALADIADFGAISTDGEIRTKAVDALKHAIFGGMGDGKTAGVAVEFGGADVLAFVNSGTLVAKGDGGDQWRDAMKNLASLVGNKCKGLSFGAALGFAINQYTASSSSVRRKLTEQYAASYQDMLVKLTEKIESRFMNGATAFFPHPPLNTEVRDLCKEEGLPAEIGNELSDLISLVDGLCLGGKIGAFSETKRGVIAALEDRFFKDQQVADDVKAAAGMLRSSIEDETTLGGVLAFSEVLGKFEKLTPQQFASLREFDIEDIRNGKFDLENLVARAENFRMVGELRSRLDASADGPTKDAVEKAAGLLTTAIEDGRTLKEMQVFGNALKALVDPSQDLYRELTPQQFSTLREDDIEIIKKGFFVPTDLISREANFREIESAIDRLSERMMAESKYAPSDKQKISALYEDIEALRLRLKSRIIPTVPPFSADGLIKRSLRDLAALKCLDFKMFAAYCGGKLDKLFRRLDYLMGLEDKLVEAANEAKFRTTGPEEAVDVRVAELKKYLDASVLSDVDGIGNRGWDTEGKTERLDDRDSFIANVAKGRFAEMSPKVFDSVCHMLKRIPEWCATETKRVDHKAEVMDVARHCVAGMLNGSITPEDVDHRMTWLSSLPVGNDKKEVAKDGSMAGDGSPQLVWHSQGWTAHFGDVAKRADDVFKRLAEKATDAQGRRRMEAFASSFERLFFDKERVVCDVAEVTLDSVEYRLKNNLPLTRILECGTFDQLRQTIRDIDAVGETFDWIGEQLQDELKKSPRKGVTVENLNESLTRFKASVTDALYGGDLDLDKVNSRLKVLFDVPFSEFAKSWLAGKNPQVTLDSFWRACDGMDAKAKEPAEVKSLDTLTLEIQQAPGVEYAGQAFMYALEQYEKRSSYLKNQATLSERIHFIGFMRGVRCHSGNDRARDGNDISVMLEFGGVLAEHFLPKGLARRLPDFYDWRGRTARFACAEGIVLDIYRVAFERASMSLKGSGSDDYKVNKIKRAND